MDSLEREFAGKIQRDFPRFVFRSLTRLAGAQKQIPFLFAFSRNSWPDRTNRPAPAVHKPHNGGHKVPQQCGVGPDVLVRESERSVDEGLTKSYGH
jgi:hypothetical protein